MVLAPSLARVPGLSDVSSNTNYPGEGGFHMKRMPMNSMLVLVVALPLATVRAAPDAGVTKDAEISAIVSSVDSTRILNTATALQNAGGIHAADNRADFGILGHTGVSSVDPTRILNTATAGGIH